jgi:hypothetical protein
MSITAPIDPPLTADEITFLLAHRRLVRSVATAAEVVYSSQSLPVGVSKRTFNEIARGIGTKRGRTWYVTASVWLAASAPKPSKARRPDVTAPVKPTVVDIGATLAASGLRLKRAGAR